MSGEGIGQALATGTWAAEAVVEAGVDGGDPARGGRPVPGRGEHRLVLDHRFAGALSGVLA